MKKEKLTEQEKAVDELNESIQKTLDDIEYKAIDDRRYSFKFKEQELVFRTPSIKEDIKIGLIQSDLTDVVGIEKKWSPERMIQSTGNLTLMCNVKVITHTTILFDNKPDDFNVDELDKGDVFDLGYAILCSENRFIDDKKKVSKKEQ